MAATRWAFLRMMGLIYLTAFASLYPQIPGLLGENGILPASRYLQAVHEHLGSRGYYLAPTLAWLHPTGGFLQLLAGTGVAVSLLAMAGVATGASFALLWILYLSLVSVGQDFLSFQWDTLLLEAGFLTIFFSPWQLGFEKCSEPSPIPLWLLRWLAFRLTFLSGVVKLQSGDRTWRNLTALHFHYETQPIPNPAAWYMHQAPAWFHKMSTVAMFGIELIVPFLVFAPGRWRRAGAWIMIGFQVLLIATGNYTFFNWLTITLCVTLLGETGATWRWPAVIPAALLVLISLLEGAYRFDAKLPRWTEDMVQAVSPFHIVNSYGLFAVMTTTRPEIMIEGSDDGRTWKTFEFPYKPGDVRRAPPFVAPHQPRLDWQMWFAAFSNYEQHPWFTHLMSRILHGSPEVMELFERNPFPDHPPRYVRAMLYDYRFTAFGQKDWWRRELLGVYFPAVSLR